MQYTHVLKFDSSTFKKQGYRDGRGLRVPAALAEDLGLGPASTSGCSQQPVTNSSSLET